ncbi:NAD-capped RNA hydrolase NUDT12 [Geodia barretti]|uniref:NAD-capped RNA hydrolase NUDT12 n=1 Tax=Geodia barretti TaxID=519541 RepID=A0AA35TPP6_GEOBA|nr:NAD-capped RNA hydrolase NUDT12 [Geodia barretti]
MCSLAIRWTGARLNAGTRLGLPTRPGTRGVASCPCAGPGVLVNAAATGNGEPALGWLSWSDLEPHVTSTSPLLLGMENGTTYFAIDLTRDESAAATVEAQGDYRFEEARSAAENLLSGPEAAIMAQGRAQVNWHNRHGFCSVCGHATEMRRGGQKRECTSCKAEHFPRTDPVIIMLVHDGERCLLGQSRGRLQAMNRYSALAGFMDQAEAIEEAVAREVMEEAGIRWFDRSEVLLALEEKSEKLRLPGPIAIAHHLIKAWAYGEVI